MQEVCRAGGRPLPQMLQVAVDHRPQVRLAVGVINVGVVAEANRVVAAVANSGASNIDAALDRWEISIAKMDANSDFISADVNDDYLAAEFEESESQQELLTELEELKQANVSIKKSDQNE